MPDDHSDLIVIGSGPGGASLAHRPAPTGKLHVADAGFFPFIGAVDPTLIIASARRAARTIKQRMGG